jgi:hypothetical protein
MQARDRFNMQTKTVRRLIDLCITLDKGITFCCCFFYLLFLLPEGEEPPVLLLGGGLRAGAGGGSGSGSSVRVKLHRAAIALV